MKKIIFLLLVSSRLWAQDLNVQAKEFYSFVNVEEAEKYYINLPKKASSDPKADAMYAEFRAQLAVDWLTKGDFKKYRLYKDQGAVFNALQIFELSNLLEKWEAENKFTAEVEKISRELIDDIENKKFRDQFSRKEILYEVNAMANARLGKLDLADQSLAKAPNTPFRSFAYFRNTKSNYLNRLSYILSAKGNHQQALDTLTAAIRDANSTDALIGTYREVYKKVHGNTNGLEESIKALQAEAYQKIYKEVEKEWKAEPIAAPDIPMTDLSGIQVKLSDHRGKIVVIDFWSTSCKPCVAAFPAFEKAVEAYKNEPFKLFVVDIGEDAQTINTFMQKKGFGLDVLIDKEPGNFKALKALGTPQKYIIDAKGNIYLTGIGYAGSDHKEYFKLKAMVELTKARS